MKPLTVWLPPKKLKPQLFQDVWFAVVAPGCDEYWLLTTSRSQAYSAALANGHDVHEVEMP